MIVILLGSPGSGKGTQSQILCAQLGSSFVHLATGDIFRSEIAAKTDLGREAQIHISAGKLVPDAIVTKMVAGRLKNISKGENYLLDGFPRDLTQAQMLTEFLSQLHSRVDLVIYLNLSHAEAAKRITSRRVCASCGDVYNILTRRPKIDGQCDHCGAAVSHREDDTEAVVAKRLVVFDELTQPLIAYYKNYKDGQTLHEVDAARSPEDIGKNLIDLVKSVAR